MTYQNQEKAKLRDHMNELFNDPGNGLYGSKTYSYVLQNPVLNLWGPIRSEAIDYFQQYGISWHNGVDNGPTGHTLSSQVACVNHLFYLRQNRDLATLVLRQMDEKIIRAEAIEGGYVAFEYKGDNELGIAVDAAMIGSYEDGQKKLFFIEWEYTEAYARESLYQAERAALYDHLIVGDNSPFKVKKPEIYYYEPFYQMMRQTLFAEASMKVQKEGCATYQIVHVMPKDNIELREKITSPKMNGRTIKEAWHQVIKHPEQYSCLSPEKLLRPLKGMTQARDLIKYLQKRYW